MSACKRFPFGVQLADDSLFADIDALALFAGIHPNPVANLYRTLAKRFPFAVSLSNRKFCADHGLRQAQAERFCRYFSMGNEYPGRRFANR